MQCSELKTLLTSCEVNSIPYIFKCFQITLYLLNFKNGLSSFLTFSLYLRAFICFYFDQRARGQ